MKLLILLILFWPVNLWANWHLYLLPEKTVSTIRGNLTQPNFDGVIPDLSGKYAVARYGSQGIVLVAADVTDAIDAALAARPNITKIPDNLDQQVGAGALATVRNALENRNIPGNWVQATTTYRTLLRTIIGGFTLLQRYKKVSGNYKPVLGSGVDLTRTFASLPAQTRTDLVTTAKELQLNTSGFTAGSTLGQILKGVGDQYAAKPFQLGGITI